MQFKRLRRSFRKQLKAQQKQVEYLSEATEKSIERNVFRRFSRLLAVRRFIASWVLLMVLIMGSLVLQFNHLSAYYQTVRPVNGGIYSEGIVGSISNVSPIYATSEADRSLSRLLFAGLLGYNQKGVLSPQLAASYAASDNGHIYTVKLRHGLTWHDGQPLTSADVAFTFNTIKNPDARSPLFSTWQNVTVAATDPYTVTFTLPSSLASFPYSLTTGIVPKHILGAVAAGSLRSSDFNTAKPIGAGPFMWHGLQLTGNNKDDVEEQVAMLPFDHYVWGQPKLSEFILRVVGSEDRLKHDFASGQLTAVADLDTAPSDEPKSAITHNLLLQAGSYVFFKNSNPVLGDVKVRQALVAASNPTSVINGLPYMTRPVVEPLLTGQLAYNKAYAQKTNDVATAKTLLAADGWQPGPRGILVKGTQQLRFNLVIADTPEYRNAARTLQAQWQVIGAAVNVQRLAISDYATALANHDYDATLHGISIGDDPDVYAYWDSSQADVRSTNRLNLSEWKNPTADQALEAGRTRTDPQLRVIKYQPFLQAWQQDAPALGLYQPRSLYITRGPLYGLTDYAITSNVDRYNGVEKWQIRSARVTD